MARDTAGDDTTNHLSYSRRIVSSTASSGFPKRDVIQIDPPQSYGVAMMSRTLAMLAEHGWSPESVMPHGGNQLIAFAAGRSVIPPPDPTLVYKVPPGPRTRCRAGHPR